MQYKKQNKKVYSTCPLGYLIDDLGNLVEDTDEQQTLTYIKSLRQQGLSYSKIANNLNNENIPTKTGKTWYSSTIKYILDNTLYDNMYSFLQK